jgi:EAL domain-containing protein (putative c-di-GMP-specific phosphodiesterase class I)
VVKGFVSTCGELGIHVVAEGVEIMEEVVALRELGIRLFQGYLFARPVVETLPAVNWEWEQRFD